MQSDILQQGKDQYDKEGYVLFPKVLDENLIAEAREHLNWLGRKYPDVKTENYQSNQISLDPFWARLISNDRLLDIAEQFIGPNIAVWGAHYFVKPPYEGRAGLAIRYIPTTTRIL